MNKYRVWGLVSALSIFLPAFGAWRKIVHYPYAIEFLTVGLIGFAISQGVYTYLKFLRLKDKNKSDS